MGRDGASVEGSQHGGEVASALRICNPECEQPVRLCVLRRLGACSWCVLFILAYVWACTVEICADERGGAGRRPLRPL